MVICIYSHYLQTLIPLTVFAFCNTRKIKKNYKNKSVYDSRDSNRKCLKFHMQNSIMAPSYASGTAFYTSKVLLAQKDAQGNYFCSQACGQIL
jgi:hypothetical protein